MYKNQLQELAQRSCFTLPSYTCIREGPDHAPRFKAAVTFNGEVFESPAFCSTLRQAEHSAAEAALQALSCRGPDRSLAARILDETGVYKNLLQEVAQRVGARLPSYMTERSGLGHLPVFTCTVELAGITFTGDPAKNKKQAEKNAASAAWTSLKQLAQQEVNDLTEPENSDEQDQIRIARALLRYRIKAKMAMADNPHVSPFPQRFPMQADRRSGSPQPPQSSHSKILPLFRSSRLHSRPRLEVPSSSESASPLSSQQLDAQRPWLKFPGVGAAPYVPVSQLRFPCHGMAPPVTIRTSVPVFSAPPLAQSTSHPLQVPSLQQPSPHPCQHQLPPILAHPPPMRMASPVRIRPAIPAYAAQPAVQAVRPVIPIRIREAASRPVHEPSPRVAAPTMKLPLQVDAPALVKEPLGPSVLKEEPLASNSEPSTDCQTNMLSDCEEPKVPEEVKSVVEELKKLEIL